MLLLSAATVQTHALSAHVVHTGRARMDGADRADRPFFPICNVNVPGRNVNRLKARPPPPPTLLLLARYDMFTCGFLDRSIENCSDLYNWRKPHTVCYRWGDLHASRVIIQAITQRQKLFCPIA